jgi:hypothetical protein
MAWTSKTKWSAADAECQFGFGQSVGLASSKSGFVRRWHEPMAERCCNKVPLSA